MVEDPRSLRNASQTLRKFKIKLHWTLYTRDGKPMSRVPEMTREKFL